MNRKEMMTKRAVKMAAAAMHILLLSVILFGSRTMLLTVQAENEMTLPAEDTALEVQTQPVPEEVVQAQTEHVADAAKVQEESTEEVPMQEESTEDTAQTESTVDPMSVTMIGDSVMLGAAAAIQEMMPGCVIDAKVSRQVKQADDVLTSLESQNAVGQIVVIGLGTNGPFSTETGQALIDRLGSGRTIYWVTVYGRELSWQEDSNAVIRELAAANENVHLIEWSQAASEHAEWICSDGIHLSVAGRAGYAGIVHGELL